MSFGTTPEVAAAAAEEAATRAREIFLAADKDGNGELSHTELKRLLHADGALREQLQKHAKMPWKEFFNELDSNHDGVIELHELQAFVERRVLEAHAAEVAKQASAEAAQAHRDAAEAMLRRREVEARAAAERREEREAAEAAARSQLDPVRDHERQMLEERRQRAAAPPPQPSATEAMLRRREVEARAAAERREEREAAEAAARSQFDPVRDHERQILEERRQRARDAAALPRTEGRDELLGIAHTILSHRPVPTELDEDATPVLYQYSNGYSMASVHAKCLMAHAMLRLAKVDYRVEDCNNEHMSPSGKLPVLVRCGGKRVEASLEEIASFAETQGLMALTTGADKADAQALRALLRSSLIRAADYELWVVRENFNHVAKPLYGTSRYPWPLDMILSTLTASAVGRETARVGDIYQTEKEIFERASRAYAAFSARLGTQPFLFGETPTATDALLYGHIEHVLRAPLPASRLRPLLEAQPRLLRFHANLEKRTVLR